MPQLIDIYIFYAASKEHNHPTQKYFCNDANAIVSKFKILLSKMYSPSQLKEVKVHFVNDAKRQSIKLGGNRYYTLNHGADFNSINDLINIFNQIILPVME